MKKNLCTRMTKVSNKKLRMSCRCMMWQKYCSSQNIKILSHKISMKNEKIILNVFIPTKYEKKIRNGFKEKRGAQKVNAIFHFFFFLHFLRILFSFSFDNFFNKKKYKNMINDHCLKYQGLYTINSICQILHLTRIVGQDNSKTCSLQNKQNLTQK